MHFFQCVIEYINAVVSSSNIIISHSELIQVSQVQIHSLKKLFKNQKLKIIKMKTIVSIFFVLFAIVAFVHSTPLPQGENVAEVEQAAEAEAAPSRPILDAISGIANTGMRVAETVAKNTGRLIEDSAKTVTNGINTGAQFISGTLTQPFQNQAQ